MNDLPPPRPASLKPPVLALNRRSCILPAMTRASLGNLLLSVTVLLFLVAAPAISHATSGACSSHGGVNCSAGSDWDGSVICYDGWRASSVSYSSMVMCQSYGSSYSSSYSSTPSCPSNSAYDSLSGNCKCHSGYVVSGSSCVSGSSYCWSNYGYGSEYDYLSKSCACSSGYIMSGGQCVSQSQYCRDELGLMSTYDTLSKSCKCMSGYSFNGVSCVYNSPSYSPAYTPTPTYYTNSCPANSYQSLSDPSQCLCNSGYQTNATKTACELTPTTSSQTKKSSGLTGAQIQSILNLLQAFGADAITIANVAVILQK